jgi:hypothetical protein
MSEREAVVSWNARGSLTAVVGHWRVCYYFVPHCDVTGLLRVDNSQVKVNPKGSMAFYEHWQKSSLSFFIII